MTCGTETAGLYDIPGTRDLHETACPGCGYEPEVVRYYRRGERRVGYLCSCGAAVIDGVVENYFPC